MLHVDKETCLHTFRQYIYMESYTPLPTTSHMYTHVSDTNDQTYSQLSPMVMLKDRLTKLAATAL
jgi:hypothetical protein